MITLGNNSFIKFDGDKLCEIDFREKRTWFACLLRSGLNCVFHW